MYKKGTVCVIKKADELKKLPNYPNALPLLAGKKVIIGDVCEGFKPDDYNYYHILPLDTEKYPMVLALIFDNLLINDLVIDVGETAKINTSKMRMFLETGEIDE